MKESDDIANLLKQFGGRPEDYYEIGRASDAKDSQARWPLLSSIEATEGERHPPVEPHRPGARSAQGMAALRMPPAPPPVQAQVDTRSEPRAAPMPGLTTAPPAPPTAPLQDAGAGAAPQAQFIPPRPRGHIVPPTRSGPQQPSRFSGARPAPSPVSQPAAPARDVFPRSAPAAAAPATPDTGTPLQAVFERLTHPTTAPVRTVSSDNRASLLQRLSHL
jgi:hypothetical protein